MSSSEVRIFGIRHHGPGSARALVAALDAYQPDMMLVEGPPEASDSIPLLADPSVKPPIALLVWNPKAPKHGVFYPFALFSPEYNALQHALVRKIPAQFMDLPLTHRLAEKDLEKPPEADDKPDHRDQVFEDLAVAAGVPSWESWWERTIESRRDASGVFDAVMELSGALREGQETEEENERREAAMRLSIRAAMKEGHGRIAVVCGAWHATALEPERFPSASADQALLKGLPKASISSTWIPWTNRRLARASGYGAGVHAPGWYAHCWRHQEPAIVSWLTGAASLFRLEGVEVSPAQVIDATRLAEALAAMRGRTAPGLQECDEAIQSVYLLGSSLPMSLIREKLVVGEDLGVPPANAPSVPLMRDLEEQQKRLRLKPTAMETVVELDLREGSARERSQFLHRLKLLDLSWGDTDHTTGKGSFKERWRLQWEPEMALQVIERSMFGATVREAAAGYVFHQAQDAELDSLAALLWGSFLSGLEEAVDMLAHRMSDAAALATDLMVLIKSFPKLTDLARYRDVRETDAAMVAPVLDEVLTRISVGLEFFITGMSTDQAREALGPLRSMHNAVQILDNPAQQSLWREALEKSIEEDQGATLLKGAFTRWVYQTGGMDVDSVRSRMSLELGAAADPLVAGAWLEGFLLDGGGLLAHHATLRQVVDAWICSVSEEDFIALLPVLRKAFWPVPEPEKKLLFKALAGQLILQGPSNTADNLSSFLDLERADLVVPILEKLLGVDGKEQP